MDQTLQEHAPQIECSWQKERIIRQHHSTSPEPRGKQTMTDKLPVEVVTPTGLGRRIMRLGQLKGDDEVTLALTRDGSVIVQKGGSKQDPPVGAGA